MKVKVTPAWTVSGLWKAWWRDVFFFFFLRQQWTGCTQDYGIYLYIAKVISTICILPLGSRLLLYLIRHNRHKTGMYVSDQRQPLYKTAIIDYVTLCIDAESSTAESRCIAESIIFDTTNSHHTHWLPNSSQTYNCNTCPTSKNPSHQTSALETPNLLLLQYCISYNITI